MRTFALVILFALVPISAHADEAELLRKIDEQAQEIMKLKAAIRAMTSESDHPTGAAKELTSATMPIQNGITNSGTDEKTAIAVEPPAEGPRYFTVLAGPNISTKSSSENRFGYGARLDWAIHRASSGVTVLGVSFSTSSETLAYNTSRLSLVMAELIGRKLWGTWLFFGSRVGLGLTNVSSTLGYYGTTTTFAYAPVFGFEAPFSHVETGPKFVIDTSWALVSGGKITGVSTFGATQGLLLHAGLMLNW